MSTKVEKVDKNIVSLEIEISAEDFNTGCEEAYKKTKGRYNIPGFRKGKAPRALIERHYGEGVFFEEAMNECIPKAYEAAVEETGIKPVDSPEYDIKDISKADGVKVTVKVTVKPEVELGKYTGLGVKKDKVRVMATEIEEELKQVADRNARLVSVEDRAVQSGDIIKLDYEGSVDGVPFEGGKADGYSLTIGSNTFIPGFEDQLVGANVEEEKDVVVTFPEDYNAEELAGKEAVFKCLVHEIQYKELPEIDDDFAQDVSEFDTLEKYKEDIKEKIKKRKSEKAETDYENNVIDEIVKDSEIDLPDCMVERRIDNILYDMNMRLSYQGMDLEKYMQYLGQTMEEFRAQFKERAEKEVLAQLCIEKVIELENIEANDDDVNNELEAIAKQYGQTVEDMKKSIGDSEIEYVKNNAKFQKAIAFLKDNNGK